MSDYVEWRIYVGPHYLDYNWSAHNEGAADDLESAATTLSSTLANGATSMSAGSGTGFPTVGGAWVGPNGSGQGWEYVQHAGRSGGSFTGLTREPSNERGHNGAHNAGAAVKLFVKITGTNGTLQFDGELDEETKCVVTWKASTGGSRYQQVLRNGHVVIVQKRHARTGSFTNALVGFVESPDVTDDVKRLGEWSLPIVSSAGLLSKIRASGVRAGDLNVASKGTASASDTLETAPLIYEERGRGDFTAANPELDAAKAIDDSAASLWIGERYLGVDNLPAAGIGNGDDKNDDTLRFTQIYVNPPAGSRPGGRWFEMTRCSSGNVQGLAIFAANGGTSSVAWLFNGPGDVEVGARLIFCEDETVFTANYPNAEYAAIYENAGFFDWLPAAGGELWLRLGELNMWLSRVAWGDANGYINEEEAPEESYTPTLPVPGPGETLRYIFDPASPSDHTDYWVSELVSHPGYELDEDNESWFIVELPGMGLKLARAMTDTEPGPGDLLATMDEAENSATGGLDDSGVIQIGAEQISYTIGVTSGKRQQRGVIVGARGYGTTDPAAHDRGDLIYTVTGSGLATDAQAISKITLIWGGEIIGEDLMMYTTAIPDTVRTPDEDGWESDWTGFNTLTGNTDASHTSYIDPTQRIKQILVKFQKMSEAPARARLTELKAILDETKFGANVALPAETVAGDIIEQILINCGFPAGSISHSGTPALTDVQTADDYAWNVIADLADYAGLKIVVGRDSKLTVTASTLWGGAQTAAYTWDRTTGKRIKRTAANGDGVSEVKIRWRNAANTDSGTVAYPEEPGLTGSPVDLDELIYATENAALTAAERRYNSLRYPGTTLVECKNNEWDKYAGAIHALDWQADYSGGKLERTCIVLSVTHRFEKRIASSAVQLADIQHTSNS